LTGALTKGWIVQVDVQENRGVDHPKPSILFSFPQETHPLLGSHCRKSVALRETNRGERVRFYDRLGFNNKATLCRGDSFEDYDLTWFKTHFPPNLCRDRDLAAFGNGCLHMMKLSCKSPTSNPSPKSLAASDQSKDSKFERTPNEIAAGG
jgi:hypothetical protein